MVMVRKHKRRIGKKVVYVKKHNRKINRKTKIRRSRINDDYENWGNEDNFGGKKYNDLEGFNGWEVREMDFPYGLWVEFNKPETGDHFDIVETDLPVYEYAFRPWGRDGPDTKLFETKNQVLAYARQYMRRN